MLYKTKPSGTLSIFQLKSFFESLTAVDNVPESQQTIHMKEKREVWYYFLCYVLTCWGGYVNCEEALGTIVHTQGH